jgi:hypothetical protein
VSVEAWIKTDKDYVGSVGTIFSNDGLLVGIDSNNVLHVRMDDVVRHEGSRPIADGVWHHVVWTDTGNGSDSRLYVDGMLDTGGSAWATARQTRGGTHCIARQSSGTPYYFQGSLDEIAVYQVALTAEQVHMHYKRGVSPYADIVTIPPARTKVSVTYYRNEKSIVRMRNDVSIADEKARFLDDGVRSAILREGDLTPVPKNTEECMLLASAYLSDRSTPKWEGSYTFVTQEGGTTDLYTWPMPGDYYWCAIDLPTGSVSSWLNVENVTSSFLGEGVYEIKLEFGAVNAMDLELRNLILKRNSSLDDLSLDDPSDILDAEVLGTTIDDLPSGITTVKILELTETSPWIVEGYVSFV